MKIPPAEWAPQSAIFTAFPSHADLWLDDLAPAQAEVTAMVKALSPVVQVHVLATGDEALAAARTALGSAAIVHDVPFGDIWLRDTGPIFVSKVQGRRFGFNGWGGKYILPHDDKVGDDIARIAGTTTTAHDFILEGGAIDGDGLGTIITTEQCLLNPNRNPGMIKADYETALAEALGTRRIIWLGDGLMGDHTDGHVDNLARFVGEGRVMLPVAESLDDPNKAIYEDARKRLASEGMEIVDMPSVGHYEIDDEVKAASYMNFVIANNVVVVPLYGASNDDAAVQALEKALPQAKVVGIRANHVLTGGGSFHCITQQQPEFGKA